MAVSVTEALRRGYESDDELELLVRNFELWKVDWPDNEYQSSHFGKDGAYEFPKIGNEKYKLRHVHLRPLADPAAIKHWYDRFRHRGRKTSDRVLVYAHNAQGDYLLIFVLPEPGAHEVAKMKTQQHRDTMQAFAKIAAAFMQDGRIIG